MKINTKSKLLKNLPNILSWLRLLFSPFLTVPIITGNKYQFFVLFVTLGLTDVADGLIARKFGLTSEYGRRIDAYADYVWAGLGTAAFLLFFGKEMFKTFLIVFLIGASYIIPLFIALIRLKGIPQLHLIANKITGIAFTVVFLLFLLIGFNLKLMWILTFILVVAGIDRGLFYLFLRNENDYKLSSSFELIKLKYSH